MSYKEHIANRLPSPYTLKSKIITAIEGVLAAITFLFAMPMIIFTLGPTALLIGPVYVLILLACLIVFALSKKPRHGLHIVIRILLALPILTFIIYLILIGTGTIPFC
ncbi:MAG: hypothetical protein E7645_09525 [Ruminococcaceae bacterium]|nr:hypothetical protein [Oscillospiraceae bacterium]